VRLTIAGVADGDVTLQFEAAPGRACTLLDLRRSSMASRIRSMTLPSDREWEWQPGSSGTLRIARFVTLHGEAEPGFGAFSHGRPMPQKCRAREPPTARTKATRAANGVRIVNSRRPRSVL
jgi:hypothetical protein